MSASDPKLKTCKAFVHLNFPEQLPTHWFCTVEEQKGGAACTNHPYSKTPCVAAPKDIDLMIAGGPCHPFSTQRVDRFQARSVAQHQEYEVTFKELSQFLESMEPKLLVSEQVEGFDLPFEKGFGETPLQRQGLSRLSKTCQACFH